MFRKIIILSGIVFSSSVFAGTMSGLMSNSQFLLGISAGPTWISGAQSQTINLEPDVTKTYTTDNQKNLFPSAELFIGWQKPLSAHIVKQPLLSQLGISIAAAGNAKVSGDIWEDADPDFDNFTYNYKVRHLQMAAKGKLIVQSGWIVDPYISGSIGIGFNRAYDFTITPKISEEVAPPPFNSNTTTSFIYTLGIGLQKSLNTHFQAAIGYEFADWGKTQLSRASWQTINNGPTQNHLYANQVQLSLFYIV